MQTGDLEVASATATASGSKTVAEGTVEKGQVIFPKVLPGEGYDVAIRTRPGPVLRLIDLSWHTPTIPSEPAAEPMAEEDRQAIEAILRDIKAFTNKNRFLHLSGDSQRATALVELIRDSDFHARKGDEVIWRIEVWYFENQAGGWAKTQQQNRVVERKRFASTAEFEAHRKPFVWIGIDKGLKIERGKDSLIIPPKREG